MENRLTPSKYWLFYSIVWAYNGAFKKSGPASSVKVQKANKLMGRNYQGCRILKKSWIFFAVLESP